MEIAKEVRSRWSREGKVAHGAVVPCFEWRRKPVYNNLNDRFRKVVRAGSDCKVAVSTLKK